MDENTGSVEERLSAIERNVTDIQRHLNELGHPPAALVEKYDGKRVHAFLTNGAVVCGTAHFHGGNWVDVENTESKKSAMCNLLHSVSINRF